MPADRICIAGGYGVKLYVERGHLVIHDGVGRQRRTVRLNRATSRLRRVVVLGHTGYVTLEALRWIRDVGAAFIQIDKDGSLVAITAEARRDDARLRRAQALAATNGVGLDLVRELLGGKLHGEAELVGNLPDSDLALAARAAITDALADLERIDSMQQLRLVEAQAARAYFAAWANVPVRFARTDEPRVPGHWRSFGTRTSPLTASPRLAANPANGILNYLFALLEAEATLACRTVGLDPGIGLLHADQKARDSLSLDLMEAVRPDVEHYLLKLLADYTFRYRDFAETRAGACRLRPPLTHRLAETLPTWAALLAPVAERVAAALGRAARIGHQPTPLTQRNRQVGRAALGQVMRQRSEPRSPRLRTCKTCGSELNGNDRIHCEPCSPAARAEQKADFAASGPAELARLRQAGHDPAHGGDAARRRSETMKQRQREAAEWKPDEAQPVDRAVFEREILPQIRSVPLSHLVKATGLSLRYVSQIRRGERLPHPRHWDGLRLSYDPALDPNTWRR